MHEIQSKFGRVFNKYRIVLSSEECSAKKKGGINIYSKVNYTYQVANDNFHYWRIYNRGGETRLTRI